MTDSNSSNRHPENDTHKLSAPPKGDIRVVKGEVETLPGLPEFLNHKSLKYRSVYALFKDLLVSERLNQLFRDFHQMVGVPVAILDLAANVLASSRWQRLCTDFHRVNPSTCERCFESDTELANQLKSGSPFTMYSCKNGLTDCASPIVIDGEHVANFFIGQFLLTQPNRDFFIKQAEEFAFPLGEYMQALEEVPVVEESRLPAIMGFLVHFAQLVAGMGLEKLHALEVEEQSRRRLEEQVEKRTVELKQRAKDLQQEIIERKQTEDNFRQSEARLAVAQRIARIGSWEWYVETNDARWSDETYRIFGLIRGKLDGYRERFLHLIIPEDRARVDQALSDAIRGTRDYDLDYRIKLPDGSDKVIHAQAEVVRNLEDKTILMRGIVQDITERKRAEKILKKRELQLIESQRVAKLGNWDLDLVSQTLEWSDQTYRLFDKDPLDFVPSFGEFARLVHPDDHATMQTHFDAAFKSDAAPYHVSVRIINDSDREWVMEAFGVVKRDKSGKAIGIFGTAQDITESKQAEKMLKEAVRNAQEEKAKTEAFISAIGDGITVHDTDFKIIYQNQVTSDLFGNRVGEYCYKAYHNRGAICEDCHFPETLKDGRIHKVETMRSSAEGPMHYEITSSPLKDAAGKIIGGIELFRDITHLKQAEEVLRRSHEEMEMLVGERTAELMMLNDQLRNLSAHLQNVREDERTRIAREIHDDLGQSLTALKMELSLLRKRPPSDQKTIVEKADSMTGLIDATIERVKRISTDLRPGILDHLGLTAAIEWHAQEFKKRSGIPCELVFEPKEIELDKDRTTAVFRVFQETLTNVARHAKATKISVLLQAQATDLLLQVKDNGKGITENEKSDPKSLGLIGIRERVNTWGGSLSIAGVPDRGTTVTVRLPLDNAGVML